MPIRSEGTTPVLTGDAAVTDVRLAKTFYNTDPTVKLTGIADLVEHQNAENVVIGASTQVNQTLYYNAYLLGNTVLSQSITTTRRCTIVVVTDAILSAATQFTQIQRGGVDKTVETTISATQYSSLNQRSHLQYATEVLDAGVYQYDLVISSDAPWIYGAVMKIVAVDFE